MSLRGRGAVLVAGALATALGACGDRGDASATAAREMPAGYEAVDAAFGVRPGDLVHEGGRSTVPVVEFRTGGDYALYPVTTGCDGSFSRGAGTLFAQDGTIREDIAAQDARLLSASPQFEGLLARICEHARNSRFVADPFTPKEAMALLFGAADANGEADWLQPAEDEVEGGMRRVSLRSSGAYTADGQRWSYLLTGARDPECEASACGGGAIGGALFRFADGRWVLASHEPAILYAGGYGEAVPGDRIHRLGADGQPPLLRVDSGACQMGECGQQASLVGVVDGRMAHLWTGDTAFDDEGTVGCVDLGHCSNWTADIRLLAGTGGAFPDLELAKTGRSWDEARGALFQLDETVVYRYAPAEGYREVSRSGEPVQLALAPPPAETGPTTGPTTGMVRKNAASADDGARAMAASQNVRMPGAGASRDATIRSMPPPTYPPAALRAGITGRVVLVVSADAQGRITDVQLQGSSRNEDLDRAAMAAAWQWEVNPALEDGRPVPSRLRVPVDFDL